MKILYRMSQNSHQRVFEKLQDRNDADQLIVGPVEAKESMPNYGYKDFGIKNIKNYSNSKELIQIVNDYRPDIYVDSVLSFFKNQELCKAISKCKLAYIHHGFCSNASVLTYNTHKKKYPGREKWMEQATNFSVAFGGIKYFYDWMGALKLDKSKIVLNAVPQIDLLYDPNYYNSRKEAVLKHIGCNINARTILFFGRFGDPGKEFDETNDEFFNVLFELHNIALKNNFMLLVKPKIRLNKIFEHIKSNKKYKKLDHKFNELFSSKNIYFIDTDRHTYQYFFSDIVVLNGSSTSEVESVLAKKPTIIINTIKNKYVNDPYGVVSAGAALNISSLVNLEDAILNIGGSMGELLNGRNKFIESNSIIFDGKAHKRVQDKLINMAIKI